MVWPDFLSASMSHSIYTDPCDLWPSGLLSCFFFSSQSLWSSLLEDLAEHCYLTSLPFLPFLHLSWMTYWSSLLLVHSLTGILSQLQVGIMLIFIRIRDLFIVVWVHPLLQYCFWCWAFSHCQNHFPILLPYNAADGIQSSLQVQKGRIDPNILKTKGSHIVQLLEDASPVAWIIFAVNSTHWANLSTRYTLSCRLGGT